MIISEKQIAQLIQLTQSYLTDLEALEKIDSRLINERGVHNKTVMVNLLTQIASQQSDKLEVVE